MIIRCRPVIVGCSRSMAIWSQTGSSLDRRNSGTTAMVAVSDFRRARSGRVLRKSGLHFDLAECGPSKRRRHYLSQPKRASCGWGSGLVPGGCPGVVDGVALAAAARKVTAKFAAQPDPALEECGLGLVGRIVTRLLGQCHAFATSDAVCCGRTGVRSGGGSRGPRQEHARTRDAEPRRSEPEQPTGKQSTFMTLSFYAWSYV